MTVDIASPDTSVLKVSLARPREHPAAAQAFDRRGARVVLGAPDAGSRFAEPIVPAAHRLFGPRGAAVTADGALWVADTGHHHLLGWPSLPTQDNQPAQWLIGQPNFGAEGRNAKAHVHAASLNVPTGVCVCGPGLAVADAWNHRVLVWHTAPRNSHVAADVVLGQADFAGGQINCGANHPSASTLYWPYGVHWDGLNLWVADTANSRVLRFDSPLLGNAQALAGQHGFADKGDNRWLPAERDSLCWPYALAPIGAAGQSMVIVDSGNNRVLLWDLA